MGDMFAPIPQYIEDNLPQLHQGMGIENIIWLYAYMFGLVTIVGAVLLIMIARRITSLEPEVADDDPSPVDGSGAVKQSSAVDDLPGGEEASAES